MQAALLERDFDTALAAARRAAALAGEKLLGRIGSLEVRMARSAAEIAAAQEVRYRVFFQELGATGSAAPVADRRDADRFDPVCDHLLVVDADLPGPDHRRVVGTYRLLRQEAAAAAGGFYSDDEFEFKGLIARHPGRRFLELGRSCVLPEYRSKRTIEALWQGIWAYVRRHQVDVLAGCASFQGSVPALHAQPLSYLAQNWRAGPAWDVRAVPGRYRDMDLTPAEAVDAKAAWAAMPPLIKAYLRLGAKIGDGCVVDADFGTTDVFVILPVEVIRPRYITYYGGEAGSLASWV